MKNPIILLVLAALVVAPTSSFAWNYFVKKAKETACNTANSGKPCDSDNPCDAGSACKSELGGTVQCCKTIPAGTEGAACNEDKECTTTGLVCEGKVCTKE